MNFYRRTFFGKLLSFVALISLSICVFNAHALTIWFGGSGSGGTTAVIADPIPTAPRIYNYYAGLNSATICFDVPNLVNKIGRAHV